MLPFISALGALGGASQAGALGQGALQGISQYGPILESLGQNVQQMYGQQMPMAPMQYHRPMQQVPFRPIPYPYMGMK